MAQWLVKFGNRMAVAIPGLTVKVAATSKVLAQRAQPHLKTFWGHARVELAPPRPSELPIIRSSFVKLGRSIAEGGYRNLTVREFTKNALVGVEIMCWFFVGEMIGRRSIVGYKV